MQWLAICSLNEINIFFQLFKLITEKLDKKKYQAVEDRSLLFPVTVG